MPAASQVHWIHYLPIVTTAVAAAFSTFLFVRYAEHRAPHLWWWAIGIACYGAGTLVEAAITLAGNTFLLTKVWYITGAILGGYPLAQGSLHLLYSKAFARRATSISLPFVLVACLLALFSPVVPSALELHRPSGAILGWRWVRLMTPFINAYAVFFLVGGAAASAWRFWRVRDTGHRVIGNILIAAGALMPGIGGALAKAGLVEALYVAECVGLIVIWMGERACAWRRAGTAAVLAERQPAAS
jgi:hypothetical protein